MPMSFDWETIRAAQRTADAARLAEAGPVALTAALQLAGDLGPYLVGEHVVRHRLRDALAVCRVGPPPADTGRGVLALAR